MTGAGVLSKCQTPSSYCAGLGAGSLGAREILYEDHHLTDHLRDAVYRAAPDSLGLLTIM